MKMIVWACVLIFSVFMIFTALSRWQATTPSQAILGLVSSVAMLYSTLRFYRYVVREPNESRSQSTSANSTVEKS